MTEPRANEVTNLPHQDACTDCPAHGGDSGCGKLLAREIQVVANDSAQSSGGEGREESREKGKCRDCGTRKVA